MAERALVERLAESIADGEPIDWQKLDHELAAMPRLRATAMLVAGIAELHRTVGVDEATEAERRVVSIEEGRARRARVEALVTAAEAAAAPLGGSPSGRTWGHLELLEKMGEGATSEVFRARDHRLDRVVALKLLKGDAAADAALSEKVLAEGRAMARVSHRNVVTVHGADRHEGRVGLWMECIEGRTLESWLTQTGPFSAGEAAHTGRELCAALAAVHATGLVHRDVKAQNVMREARGRLVLMDFGTGQLQSIAAQKTTRLQGTPLYLAPEVLDGGAATVRSDLYSLGVLLFHLLTGRYPIAAASLAGLIDAHRQGGRVHLRDLRPDLPAEFVETIEKALEPDPTRRFASAGEMDNALARTMQATPAVATPAVEAPPRPRAWGRGALAVLAVALVAVIAVAGAWLMGRRQPQAGAADGTLSIAVLPLLDASGDKAYLADGLTDAIIQEIGGVKGVRVISRASVMRFKNPDRSLSDIAKELHVGHVLEGSVREADGRVRLSVRLLAAGADTPVWLENFDVVSRDVLRLPARAADRVRRWLGQPTPVAASAGSISSDANEEFLRGKSAFLIQSLPGTEEAIRHFRTAIDLEPGFAAAWAALSEAEMWLAGALPSTEGDPYRLARDGATQALQLDPTSPEALTTLARLSFGVDWDFAAAETGFHEALQHNPNSVIARVQYANFLAARGLTDRALQEIREARRVDPLSADTQAWEGVMLYYARRFDDALVAFNRSLALSQNNVLAYNGQGRTLIAMGRYDEAIASFDEVRRRGAVSLSAEAMAAVPQALAGRTAEARAVLARIEAAEPAAGVATAAPLSWLRTALGDVDGAMDALERAADAHVSGVLWMVVDPRFDALRDTPRFKALVARIGIDGR